MFLRTFSAALLMLAACSKGAPDPVADAKPDDRIECAVGAAALAKDCVAEAHGDTIIVRHADGAFRRFEIGEDGHMQAADGAAAVETLDDGTVRIGDERYRLPPR